MTPRLRLAAIVWCVSVLCATAAAAGDRYALVVAGASGLPDYAPKYRDWRVRVVAALRETFSYPDDHIAVLAEETGPGVASATRENVRAALADIRKRASKDDVVLVLLMGHGTADGDEAKFNLVGPDLSAREWAALVQPIAGRLVFVDTTSAGFPFLHALAAPGRVVVTATDSAAQEFETVFPEFLTKALTDPAADQDKNGKLSIWEAFTYASAGVRQWFQQRGQLATERPLLDDTGRGVGREADSTGADGSVAQVTYLQADRAVDSTGEVGVLRKRRAELEADLELLRARKSNLPADEYQQTLERLLLEIARLDRQIRSGS